MARKLLVMADKRVQEIYKLLISHDQVLGVRITFLWGKVMPYKLEDGVLKHFLQHFKKRQPITL